METHLYRLLILNLALQLFDGVATYQGLRLGFREANPLLLSAFDLIGVGPALLLFKAKACGLLVLLHRATPPRIGIVGPARCWRRSTACCRSARGWGSSSPWPRA